LISVSLAPGSYFLSAAKLAVESKAAMAIANVKRPVRRIFIVFIAPWECVDLHSSTFQQLLTPV
jgi:hypothetical protein